MNNIVFTISLYSSANITNSNGLKKCTICIGLNVCNYVFVDWHHNYATAIVDIVVCCLCIDAVYC